jgi:hypothetical protein
VHSEILRCLIDLKPITHRPTGHYPKALETPQTLTHRNVRSNKILAAPKLGRLHKPQYLHRNLETVAVEYGALAALQFHDEPLLVIVGKLHRI